MKNTMHSGDIKLSWEHETKFQKKYANHPDQQEISHFKCCQYLFSIVNQWSNVKKIIEANPKVTQNTQNRRIIELDFEKLIEFFSKPQKCPSFAKKNLNLQKKLSIQDEKIKDRPWQRPKNYTLLKLYNYLLSIPLVYFRSCVIITF